MKPHVSKPTQHTNVITLQRNKESGGVWHDISQEWKARPGEAVTKWVQMLKLFPSVAGGGKWMAILKKGPSQGFCDSTSNVFLFQQVLVPFNIQIQWQKHDILRDLYFMLVNEMRKGLAYASEYQCITTINLKCGTWIVDHTGGQNIL